MRSVLTLYPKEISDSYYHSTTVVSSFCDFSSGKGEHRGGSPRFGVRSECGTITEAGSVLTTSRQIEDDSLETVLTTSRRIEDDSWETKSITASSEPRLSEPIWKGLDSQGPLFPWTYPRWSDISL